MQMPAVTIEHDEQVRMSLKPDGPVTGYVDGAWWPASRDLAVEVPALLAPLAARLGWVERVIYNLTVWDPAPRRLVVDGGAVRLGGFRTQPAETVTAIGRGGERRLTLLVVPPETDPATAARVLARASQPGNAEDLEKLLAPTHVAGTGTPNRGACATQRWEGEGGSVGERADAAFAPRSV
jgi:hypothetical protein